MSLNLLKLKSISLTLLPKKTPPVNHLYKTRVLYWMEPIDSLDVCRKLGGSLNVSEHTLNRSDFPPPHPSASLLFLASEDGCYYCQLFLVVVALTLSTL